MQGHLVVGDARDALINEAEKLHANSIVIGSRGLGQIKGALLGKHFLLILQYSLKSARPFPLIFKLSMLFCLAAYCVS